MPPRLLSVDPEYNDSLGELALFLPIAWNPCDGSPIGVVYIRGGVVLSGDWPLVAASPRNKMTQKGGTK